MKCEIFPDKERQTIDGFGVSEAFNKAGGIYRLPLKVREYVLDLLFDAEKGIGLSIIRNAIGDGGVNSVGWGNAYNGSAETIRPSPDKCYVWEMPEWPEKKNDFDFQQIWITREALKRGAKSIMATCWSPPYFMKSNGSVIGDRGAILLKGYYRDFAEYLAEYILGYQREFGLNITHISPCNEPENITEYPGCQWMPEQLTEFVRDFLAPVFKEKQIDAKLALTEYEHWRENDMVKALLYDEACRKFTDIIAAHAYYADIDNLDTFESAKKFHKPLWVSETGEYSFKGESADSMEAALYLARLIQKLHAEADVCGFLYWWGAADCISQGSTLIKLGNSADDAAISVSRRLYALGHFSKFIRPGYKRIETRNECENLYITAYKPSNGESVIAIAVNSDSEPKVTDFKLAGEYCSGRIRRFVTDEYRNLTESTEMGTKIAIPEKSIVTLILSQKT
ncbi:MAG: hypothetical protein LBS62_01470 [Clostridiales bacterium]|jgi:glucuronoarabinoxylan endo-1,4-beta-xylanase|nr:hypothetical protein [Clostridiales bacterium]